MEEKHVTSFELLRELEIRERHLKKINLEILEVRAMLESWSVVHPELPESLDTPEDQGCGRRNPRLFMRRYSNRRGEWKSLG